MAKKKLIDVRVETRKRKINKALVGYGENPAERKAEKAARRAKKGGKRLGRKR